MFKWSKRFLLFNLVIKYLKNNMLLLIEYFIINSIDLLYLIVNIDYTSKYEKKLLCYIRLYAYIVVF